MKRSSRLSLVEDEEDIDGFECLGFELIFLKIIFNFWKEDEKDDDDEL